MTWRLNAGSAWICKSHDPKPQSGAGIGDILVEADTGKTFLYAGPTAGWIEWSGGALTPLIFGGDIRKIFLLGSQTGSPVRRLRINGRLFSSAEDTISINGVDVVFESIRINE